MGYKHRPECRKIGTFQMSKITLVFLLRISEHPLRPHGNPGFSGKIGALCRVMLLGENIGKILCKVCFAITPDFWYIGYDDERQKAKKAFAT